MRKFNDEILIDYIFNLLSNSESLIVENDLKSCCESRERLDQLRQKFKMLDIGAPKTSRRLPIYLSAAATILIIFLSSFGQVSKSGLDKTANIKQQIDYFEIANKDHFSTIPENYTLMAELPSPVLPEQYIEIPEARIVFESEESAPTVNFLSYTLNQQSDLPENRSMEYYCTLKLTN